MLLLGLLFAVLCALSKAIDTLINKDVMRDLPAQDHAVYRIIFVSPVLLIAALFHWRLEAGALWWLLLYGALEAVNILTHQLAVKKI